jgi:hypothetical protein
MSLSFGLLAVIAFAIAVVVDAPWPRWPKPGERLVGNFACSLGWLFLTLYLVTR